MALHPVVLARPSTVAQIAAALDRWQAALLLPLPGPDRRAGHASPELVRRLDRHAAVALLEVGTRAFAARQAAQRRAGQGIMVESSHEIVGLRIVDRGWSGEVLVEATVFTTVERATYQPRNGTWHSPVTAATVVPIRARLRDTLGVWRIVSVAP
jgi:hypothetical protein